MLIPSRSCTLGASGQGQSLSTMDPALRTLDVALWFALNSIQRIKTQHVFGAAGPIDSENDKFATASALHYTENMEGGWLYIFDVPLWTTENKLSHGSLVDCAYAPNEIRKSARITAQQACLIYADHKLDDGDLSSFLAVDPIEVARPMTGWHMASISMDELFPPPKIDQWYDRLISVPWTRQINPDTKLAEPRPMPVSLYVSNSVDAMKDVANRLILAPNYYVLPDFMQKFDQLPSEIAQLFEEYPLSQATCIQLHDPMFLVTYGVDSHLWNPGLLTRNIADRIDVVDAQSGDLSGTANLRSVLVEMSPLEYPWWHEVENGETQRHTLKALWLVRRAKDFLVTFVYQDVPGPADIEPDGPYIVRLDHDSNRFVYRGPRDDPQSWTSFLNFPNKTKNLYVVLDLLRELTPEVKARAFPFLSGERREGGTKLALEVYEAPRRLVRTIESGTGDIWHIAEHVGPSDFDAPDTTRRGVFMIGLPGQFEDWNPDDIVRTVAEQFQSTEP